VLRKNREREIIKIREREKRRENITLEKAKREFIGKISRNGIKEEKERNMALNNFFLSVSLFPLFLSSLHLHARMYIAFFSLCPSLSLY
jgi:hypothetical protein